MMKTRHTRSASMVLMLTALATMACNGGYDSGYDRGYNAGYAEGQKEGYSRGQDTGILLGRTTRVAEFAAYGGVGGFSVGFILLAVATRRRWLPETTAMYRRHRLKLMVGRAAPLSAPLAERVISLGVGLSEFRDRLKEAAGGSPAVQALHERLDARLDVMGLRLLDIAITLQHMRDTLAAVPCDVENMRSHIHQLQTRLAEACDITRPQLRSALEAQERKLRKVTHLQQHTERCEIKLDNHTTFLENLTLSLGQLRNLDHDDAFEHLEAELGDEIDDLEQTLAASHRSLEHELSALHQEPSSPRHSAHPNTTSPPQSASELNGATAMSNG